jgi:signal transduction histidine kinase
MRRLILTLLLLNISVFGIAQNQQAIDSIEIRVEDNGSGMPESVKA